MNSLWKSSQLSYFHLFIDKVINDDLVLLIKWQLKRFRDIDYLLLEWNYTLIGKVISISLITIIIYIAHCVPPFFIAHQFIRALKVTLPCSMPSQNPSLPRQPLTRELLLYEAMSFAKSLSINYEDYRNYTYMSTPGKSWNQRLRSQIREFQIPICPSAADWLTHITIYHLSPNFVYIIHSSKQQSVLVLEHECLFSLSHLSLPGAYLCCKWAPYPRTVLISSW